MDRADVGMIESGSGLRLTLKRFEGLMVLSEVFRQKLQRDKAVELDVFGFVNDAHPAATELLDDPVVRDVAAD